MLARPKTGPKTGHGPTRRYWGHVAGLAAREMRGELAKSSFRVIGGGIVGVLIYAGIPGIGWDKVIAIVVFAVAGPAVAFVWKLVKIPPKLHEWQIESRDHRVAADDLKALMDDGYRLLNDSSNGSAVWWNQTLDWEERVNARLLGYSAAELALFETGLEERAHQEH